MLINLPYKNSREWRRFAAIALGFGFLSACTQNSGHSAATGEKATGPKVVATTSVLCDLVQQIAEKTVDLSCLLKPGADPHSYEPTPGDRKAIEDAKLILYGGYGFEPSLIKLIQSTAPQIPKVAVSEETVPNPQAFNVNGHAEADPHVWHNALNGVRMVQVIQGALATANPDQIDLYAQKTQRLETEIAQIDLWIQQQILTIPKAKRTLVTTHDALGYYAKAYELPIEGALGGVSTEEKPTAARIKTLVDIVRKTKVPTIFAESTINPKLIEAVAKEAKVKVSAQALFTDGIGEMGSEGDTYQKMLIANTKAIVEGLGGKYTPLVVQKTF